MARVDAPDRSSGGGDWRRIAWIRLQVFNFADTYLVAGLACVVAMLLRAARGRRTRAARPSTAV